MGKVGNKVHGKLCREHRSRKSTTQINIMLQIIFYYNPYEIYPASSFINMHII